MVRRPLLLSVFALIAAPMTGADVPMVRLAGSPAEIGKTWGEINRRTIVRDVEVNYLNQAAKAGIAEETLLERARAFIRIAQEHAPHWLEETRAIALAAGVREEIYTAAHRVLGI